MKKILLILLGLGIFSGCTKHELTLIDSNDCKVIERIEKETFDNSKEGKIVQHFKYDNLERISKVETITEDKTLVTTYSYSENQINVAAPGLKIVYNLNKDKLIESAVVNEVKKLQFVYNSNKQLVSAHNLTNNRKFNLEYMEGNLTKASVNETRYSFKYDEYIDFPSFGTISIEPFNEMFSENGLETAHVLYTSGFLGEKIKYAISTVIQMGTDTKLAYVHTNRKATNYIIGNNKSIELLYKCK